MQGAEGGTQKITGRWNSKRY